MTATKLSVHNLPSHIGEALGTSHWITVGQRHIDDFAACTGDHQWLHVDVERARRESPFGGTIAHGYLTLSLLAPTGLEVLAGRVAVKQAVNFGLDKVRFLAPVRAGARVRNHIRLANAEARHGGLLVTTENSLEIEGEDKPALHAVTLTLLMA